MVSIVNYVAETIVKMIPTPANPLSFGVAAAVFISLLVAVRGFFAMASGDASQVRRRVDEIARRGAEACPVGTMVETGRGGERHVVRLLKAIVAGKPVTWLSRALEKSELDRVIILALERADLFLKPAEFLTGAAVFSACSVFAGMLLGRAPGAVLGGIAGLWGPIAWLRARRNRRLKRFDSQLPDALTMTANSLRSGYSLLQALDVVAREMPKPISAEFARIVREVGFNVPIEDSLGALLKRVESDDLDLLVTAILIQRQVGGNLAEVLDRISTTIRERMRILGEVRTLTAQGRISGLVVALLPVGLCGVLAVTSRDYLIPFLTHPLGKMLLGVGCMMQVAGIAIVRKIVNIRV